MHAGEAFWQMHAILAAVGQRTMKDPVVTALLVEAEQCCEVIGNHIQVAPPPIDVKMSQAAAVVERLADEKEEDNAAGGITSGEAREAFELATGILADLEELPEEANEFAESVGERVRSIRSYVEKFDRVSSKQMAALQNMRGGVDRWMHR